MLYLVEGVLRRKSQLEGFIWAALEFGLLVVVIGQDIPLTSLYIRTRITEATKLRWNPSDVARCLLVITP